MGTTEDERRLPVNTMSRVDPENGPMETKPNLLRHRVATLNNGKHKTSPLTGIAYFNDAYVSLEQATVSMLDLGFIHCDATYEVCHSIQGRIFRPEWHFERFRHSLDGMRLSIPHDNDMLLSILSQCSILSGFRDTLLWMICTRGVPPSGNPRDIESCVPVFTAYAKEYYDLRLADESEDAGLHLWISNVIRTPPTSLDPSLKNFQWGDLTRAQFEAHDEGADTAVLVDGSGNITEGFGFNIFALIDGALVTPAENILPGVTRRAIFLLCNDLNITVCARPLTAGELQAASEVFLTSTAGGITFVSKINRHLVGSGRQGEVTRMLSALYWEKHSDPEWSVDTRAITTGARS